jgi:hypothetical protein
MMPPQLIPWSCTGSLVLCMYYISQLVEQPGVFLGCSWCVQHAVGGWAGVDGWVTGFGGWVVGCVGREVGGWVGGRGF